jgi:hypothetical protein
MNLFETHPVLTAVALVYLSNYLFPRRNEPAKPKPPKWREPPYTRLEQRKMVVGFSMLAALYSAIGLMIVPVSGSISLVIGIIPAILAAFYAIKPIVPSPTGSTDSPASAESTTMNPE